MSSFDLSLANSRGSFELFAELRNSMYTLALVEDPDEVIGYETAPKGRKRSEARPTPVLHGPIHVNARMQEPGALRACRQMRNEARTMWYISNHFTIDVFDCEITRLLSFTKRTAAMRGNAVCNLTVNVIEGGDWDGLRGWCYAFHEDQGCNAIEKSDDKLDDFTAAVVAVTAIAQEHCGLPWFTCEEALEKWWETDRWLFGFM
ncbi:hypothetical protein Slin15195_G065750 [Septoria linicola]|uniref:Uncharacterized protein n=1 Tax=Septoria linicola TaxID=215465 RepID=A0A9Q9AWT0_9PEZI|nr:hypothetical protein Slin14017_G116090 [Septoria linicola]USW53256.1 hypothetical protein Slin15195_G065750 [Septoria linicola]